MSSKGTSTTTWTDHPLAGPAVWVGRLALVGLVTAGGAVGAPGSAGAAAATPASAAPGPTPCSVELELGPTEVAPSTTVPGTCIISATSGTVPAPPGPAPASTSSVSPAVVVSGGRPERWTAALRAVFHAGRRAMFLTSGAA